MNQLKVLCLIDRIEDSSYPVTETGYALVYRAWLRGAEVYVAYPDAGWRETPAGALYVLAQRVVSFVDAPYCCYRSQRSDYRAGAGAGSARCHVELEHGELLLNTLDAVVWRQETGEPERATKLLQALARLEQRGDTLMYLSPRIALDPRMGSKNLPHLFDAKLTPRTHHTSATTHGIRDKAREAVRFMREQLGEPETVIAKPLNGNNGVGVHVLGRDPVTHTRPYAVDDVERWLALLERHGDLVVQEYIPSVRSPVGDTPEALSAVPQDRHDFGEIRFLLIDGDVPRDAEGKPLLVARRVPAPHSLIADSGISYPTSLSAAELAFLERLGPVYRRLGIYFGGGDLIRTPDPARPFVFTDAARHVCGHAVVTGALNGAPYAIVDRVLDSVERRVTQRRPVRFHDEHSSA